MTDPKPKTLTHPESGGEVETLNPEPYLSQGWEVAGKKSTASESDAK